MQPIIKKKNKRTILKKVTISKLLDKSVLHKRLIHTMIIMSKIRLEKIICNTKIYKKKFEKIKYEVSYLNCFNNNWQSLLNLKKLPYLYYVFCKCINMKYKTLLL